MPTAAPPPITPQLFEQFIRDYRKDPVSFVTHVLGVVPDKWQGELLTAIAEGNRRISVRSGHGVGKSTTFAWAAIWFILTRYPAKVVVTAPTTAQLFDALFAEIKKWIRELPPVLQNAFEVKAEKIVLQAAPDECFISARTSRAEQPEALQGVHSDNVLLIADEASGIPEGVFEAASGSMSGHNATTLLAGNPVRSTGFFYDTHNRLSHEWKTFRVSCLDSPRVSAEYVQEMKSRYGEDSNSYRIRVLGEFPLGDDDTVIPMDLLESARHRDTEAYAKSPVVWGLDVARFGSDSSCLVKRKSNVIVGNPRIWNGLDLMQLTGAVVAEWNTTPEEERPVEILVDSIGVGAGACDRLRELRLPARGINVSESPALGQHYVNLRAELWLKAKAWLEKRDCKIPDDERLVGELAMVRYKYASNGKIQIESKDQIKKRGRKSPDVADAFVLTFASDAATGLHGWAAAGSWTKPLKRNVKGVV